MTPAEAGRPLLDKSREMRLIIAMARITVEDCLAKIPNRFELVILGSRRAKQLFQGAKPLIQTDNKEIVTALREIAAGEVRKHPAQVAA